MKPVELIATASSKNNYAPNVLIVDDDPMALLLAQKVLSTEGTQVFTAKNGAEAIEVFAQQSIDIILMDVEMPIMNGFDSCKAIRLLEDGETVPVLMITGLDDSASIEKAFDAGATDFAAKPINWSILSHRVRYMMRAGRAFKDSRNTHAQLVDAQRLAKLGNWVWNIEDEQMVCSAEVFSIFGKKSGAWSNGLSGFYQAVHDDDLVAVTTSLKKARLDKRAFAIEFRLKETRGKKVYVYMTGEPELNATGELIQITGIIQDITRRRQDEEKIRRLAYFDSLTGLINRATYKERLFLAIENARRLKQQVAILFIDLDDFKRINDTLGHTVGDQVLTTIASRLKENVRATDCLASSSVLEYKKVSSSVKNEVARLGGDEFTVALTGIKNSADAATVAQRILSNLSRPIVLEKQELRVTPSIGISIFPEDGEDVDTLISNADTAMYHAKGSGRNNFRFYHQSMNKNTLERLNLETQLRNALEKNEFTLNYQPLFQLDPYKMVGVEALIRWNNPELGMVSPGDFIPLAEEIGLIVEIGEWVLSTACQQHKKWLDAGFPPLRVAVNLSSLQFQHPKLVAEIQNALEQSKMDPAYLDLELTENLIMQDHGQTIEALHTLKEMGLRLSIDDFGTGYSSLSYLKRLPISILKIDRSFVTDIPSDKDDVAITKAIIAMAHSLNLTVIAEGIETEEQLAFLTSQGCEEAQGFLLGKPQTGDSIMQLLEKSHSKNCLSQP